MVVLFYFPAHQLQTVNTLVEDSVADPDPNPDPPDPHVFGPPGSGSGSFYHQENLVRKTFFSTVLRLLFYFLSLTNDVKEPSKSNMQENFFFKLVFF